MATLWADAADVCCPVAHQCMICDLRVLPLAVSRRGADFVFWVPGGSSETFRNVFSDLLKTNIFTVVEPHWDTPRHHWRDLGVPRGGKQIPWETVPFVCVTFGFRTVSEVMQIGVKAAKIVPKGIQMKPN